jgi:excisionase family DNA binding protein
MSPLLTARAVAALLGLSPATVRDWTRAGKLPALRLPSGAWRYRREELERWLDGRAATRPTPTPAPDDDGGVAG